MSEALQVSPDVMAASKSTRTPDDVLAARHANHTLRAVAQITALFEPKPTFRPGQSSLDAAREDEEARMKAFYAAFNNLLTIARAAQKHTEITAIDERLGEFVSGLQDLQSDCSLRPEHWEASIGGVR